MATRASTVEALKFLRRSRGIVDAYVGGVLVGSLFRVRSPSVLGTSWTARPLGEPSTADLTLAEAKVVLRFSDRARALLGALYPDPGRSPAETVPGPSEGRPLRQGPLPARSAEWSEEASTGSSPFDHFGPRTPT